MVSETTDENQLKMSLLKHVAVLNCRECKAPIVWAELAVGEALRCPFGCGSYQRRRLDNNWLEWVPVLKGRFSHADPMNRPNAYYYRRVRRTWNREI